MASHTTTGEWKSFENRMRRRRVERLLLRATVALEEGCLDAARATVEEARRLAPGLPALDDLDRQIDAAPSGPPPSAAPTTVRSVLPLMAVAAVASLAVGTVIAMRPPAIVPAQDFRTVQVAPQPTAGTTPLTSLSFAARDTQADAAKADATPPAARALDRRTNGTPAMPSVMPVSLTTAALPPVPADASTGIPALASNTSAPPIEPPAPSRGSADDETAVRGTIDRYAAAYNGLDADAAQVSLGDCRIDVNGAIARASCAGTASWTARAADGAARTEPRRWTFDLARSGDVWQIVNTKVQNR